MRATRSVVIILLAGCGFAPSGDAVGDAHRPSDAAALDGAPDAPSTIDAAIPADWWNTAWSSRSPIVIDNSKVTGTELQRFPVLVTLTPADFNYGVASAGGADLRFIGSDGETELPHEIDAFVANGVSQVWVAVDLPQTPAPGPQIWIYYGNPAGSADDAPGALWSPDVGVFHLGALTDSSGGGHTAAPGGSNTSPTRTAGIVGDARSFDGGSDALDLANSSTGAFDFGNTMSLSLWLDAPAFSSGSATSFECFVCKGDKTWRVQRATLTDTMDFGTTSGGTNGNLAGSAAVDGNTWHHLGVVKSGANMAVYVDGVRQPTTVNNAGQLDESTQPVVFGENDEAAEKRNLHGLLDEVRITATPLPDVWMLAEYNTVTQSDFAVVGPRQKIR